MTDLSTITPEEELDLSEFGLQPFEDDFLIVEAGFEDSDNGRRWYVIMEPQDADPDTLAELPNGQVRDGGYLTHVDRAQLVRIGTGSLKRLFKAVLGKESAAISELEGEMVHARVEERNGFAQPGRYAAVR